MQRRRRARARPPLDPPPATRRRIVAIGRTVGLSQGRAWRSPSANRLRRQPRLQADRLQRVSRSGAVAVVAGRVVGVRRALGGAARWPLSSSLPCGDPAEPGDRPSTRRQCGDRRQSARPASSCRCSNRCWPGLPQPVIALDRPGRGARAQCAGAGDRAGAAPRRAGVAGAARAGGARCDPARASRATCRSGSSSSSACRSSAGTRRSWCRSRCAATPRRRPGWCWSRFDDLTPLRRVEEMRADFVANASHELRTPLAALSGFIETLQGPARDDAGGARRDSSRSCRRRPPAWRG